jgi:hypothetical protein
MSCLVCNRSESFQLGGFKSVRVGTLSQFVHEACMPAFNTAVRFQQEAKSLFFKCGKCSEGTLIAAWRDGEAWLKCEHCDEFNSPAQLKAIAKNKAATNPTEPLAQVKITGLTLVNLALVASEVVSKANLDNFFKVASLFTSHEIEIALNEINQSLFEEYERLVNLRIQQDNTNRSNKNHRINIDKTITEAMDFGLRLLLQEGRVKELIGHNPNTGPISGVAIRKVTTL